MSEQTKIPWCDSTINFWEGCSKVSAGCLNCYAEARDRRFTGGKHWGPYAPRRKSKSAVAMALRLNAKPWICDGCGAPRSARGHRDSASLCRCGVSNDRSHRRRIFSLSLGDWLDPEVPIEWLSEMLDTIRLCDAVEWILCSKRPELFIERTARALDSLNLLSDKSGRVGENWHLWDWIGNWRFGKPPANITLLASVENQAMADLRIPQLLAIPAARHGLSLEPLLGPVNLYLERRQKLDWLIIGGESGPRSRPCNVAWIRSLIGQGKAAGVPVFVKQLGADPRHNDPTKESGDCTWMNLRDKKGGDPSEWRVELRVQQWSVCIA